METSGYDVPFLAVVADRFLCPICLLVLKNPMQTACGHRFCDGCIKRVYVSNNVLTCPVDKQYSRVNQMFQDVAIQREILSLCTLCTNNLAGCHWRGELRDLQKHCEVCPKEEVKCPACEQCMQRAEMDRHVVECPSRQVDCVHCQRKITYRDLGDHTKLCPRAIVKCDMCKLVSLPREEMSSHIHPESGTCSKMVVVCPYKIFGCTFAAERLKMSSHQKNDEVQGQHMELLRGKFVDQDRIITELAEQNDKLARKLEELIPVVNSNKLKNIQMSQSLLDRNVTGRLHWKIKVSNSQRGQRRGQHFSPELHTGCPGYKVQFLLDVDGHRESNLRYSTLHMILMAGEYDEQLIFPFNATCMITLYDQTSAVSRRENFTTTMIVREVPRVVARPAAGGPGSSGDRIYRRGINTFMKKQELVGSGSRFMRHGALHMEITVLHCFYPPPEMAAAPCVGPVLSHSVVPLPAQGSSSGRQVPSPCVSSTTLGNAGAGAV